MSNSQDTAPVEKGALALKQHFGATCAEVYETNTPVHVTRAARNPARPAVIISDAMWHAACQRHPRRKPKRVADVMPAGVACKATNRDIFLPVAREGWHIPVTAGDDWAVWFVPPDWWEKVRD